MALGVEDFEQADRAVLVAKARQLERAGERREARCACDEDVAGGGLHRDRVAHLAECVGDRLLVLLRRFARARFREAHAAADLPAGEERLQQPRTRAPGARRSLEEIRERLALAAVIACQRDRREICGTRHADTRVRRMKLRFRRAQIRTPQQEVRRQARRHFDGRSRGSAALDARVVYLARTAAQQDRERAFLAHALLLESRHERFGRRALGFDLAQLHLGDGARVVAHLLQLVGLALRGERVGGDGEPPVDRPQLEVSADHIARDRVTDRVASRLARGEIGARRFRRPAVFAPEVDLPLRGQHEAPRVGL